MAKQLIHPSVTYQRVENAVTRAWTTLDNPGICLACGHEQEGCEPDARRYECDECEKRAVYGAEEIMLIWGDALADECYVWGDQQKITFNGKEMTLLEGMTYHPATDDLAGDYAHVDYGGVEIVEDDNELVLFLMYPPGLKEGITVETLEEAKAYIDANPLGQHP